MIKARAWPAKAMYMLIAAALAISLLIMVAPAQKVSAQNDVPDAKWKRVSTPTVDDWVLSPDSTIVDFAVGDGGDVAYAIVYEDGYCDREEDFGGPGYLLKSTDGAATWENITKGVQKEIDDEIGKNTTFDFVAVATDGEDADFVAVALDIYMSSLHVFVSGDGGDNFVDTGLVRDANTGFELPANRVFAFAVSTEVEEERDIAIGGATYDPYALIFRCTVEVDDPDKPDPGKWKDARYKGWDDTEDGVPDDLGSFFSAAVVEIQFSPSWATDKKTVLVVTVDNYNTNSGAWGPPGSVYLQSGSWGATPAWNEKASYPETVLVAPDVYIPPIDGAVAGIALPEDYKGTDSSSRILWVWVNYCTDNSPWWDEGYQECQIYRVADDTVDDNGPQGQIHDGDFWLTNISYKGNIDEGEAIAGVLGRGSVEYIDYEYILSTDCCEGVDVYHNGDISDMIICCKPWEKACKPPTGRTAMEVVYVGEDKAYAVAVESGLHPYFFWLQADPALDESAWSVTFDDGDTWNQLSLIDTYIDYFSDVAVSPDCNKTMLVSVQKVPIEYGGDECLCDSVWLHAETLYEAEEYSGKWLRTWCGELLGVDDDDYEHGILRLAPEELEGEDVKTVYLVDLGTDNVYYNDLETLACWKLIAATVDDIADLAVADADTLFALDYNGDVAMYDDEEWHKEVDSKVDSGWTIAVWGDHILVGGQDGEVSYSDDGGETFDLLEETPTFDGYVTVAFDTYFDTNMTIYAAVAWADDNADNGIYRWIIGESDKWKDLKAEPLESQIGLPLDTVGLGGINATDDTVEVNYTGLVVDRPGNPFTVTEKNGGVIYASYEYWDGYTWATGAARSLQREVTICTTCLVWDFLHMGLHIAEEDFWAYPDALKICGCLTPDTNTHLFAIDWYDGYDFCENEYGSVWTYEDCYAKKAPEITYPTDGDVIDADPCSCYSIPFTVLWNSICDACSYDIAFALDEEFEMPVKVNGEKGEVYHIVSDTPSYSVMGGEAGGLSCETTYYVRVRAADAATDEIIHSWWSVPIEITIAPSLESGEITLVSPEPGATGVAIKNVGFSWDLLAEADSFDWWLDDNADFSSPVESATVTSTAYECTVDLEYSTSYYWKVTAYNEGVPISTSAVGTFTTTAQGEFCCPQCGLCFDTQEELEAHIAETHPAQPATPTWVWVVIAIGAVLVIVVIVLIFRTRRV
jgi:hypothetical protein